MLKSVHHFFRPETPSPAAAAVLGYNFPGSDWYLDSYALLEGVDLRPEADDESWISRAFYSIF